MKAVRTWARLRAGAGVVCALLMGAGGLLGQGVTSSAVTGTVTGEDGKGLPGMQVVVKNTQTGAQTGSLTRADGRYFVQGLQPGGPYTVRVEGLGYATQQRTGISLTLSQTSRIDFQLSQKAVELGAIEVTAQKATEAISPTRTAILTTISDSALNRLPSINRNFTDFVKLTPQVSTTLENGGLSGGGVNNRYNQVQIDGTTETDLFGLGSTGQPGGQANGKSIGIEAVKEYQVLLTPFDVRYGNFAGLLINAVTKSGTNDLHGSVYGFGRNQTFAREQPYINDFSQYQYGATLGGPIVKDRIMFFTNAEWQSYSTPTTGIFLGSSSYPTLTQGNVDAAKSVLDGYGIPTGDAGQVKLKNPLTNIFARLDFAGLPLNTSMVLRYNYSTATNEALGRGSSGASPTLSLTSNQYQYASTKHAPAVELRTQFKSGASNEFRAAYTRIRDPRTSVSGTITPQVTVNIPGASLVAGTERYSQGNNVEQDIFDITNNFTLPVGSHTLLVGVEDQIFKALNLYAQSNHGVWQFDSLDSLRNGLAYSYIVGVPAPGTGDGHVQFTTQTLAGYMQDQWSASPNLTVTYGLRVDLPIFNSKPPVNPLIQQQYGRNTSEIPSGNLQWSPRVGFNWDVTGDQKNQLRGGIGAFTGHPAYVWLSNAFQNSGLTGVNLLTCTRKAPAFNSAAVQQAPTSCSDGTSAQAGSEVDLVQPGTRMPQTLRGSLGYDRDIGHNLVVTAEGMYTKGLYSPFYTNLALKGQQGVDNHGRVMYGPQPGKPVLTVPSRNTVIDVTNQSNDHFYNLTGQLTRRYANHWQGSAAYTYSRGWDVQSFSSSTALSQWRYGRVWAGDENDKTATRSLFEQRHRVVAQASYTFPTQTTLSFMYTGASGSPYAFVYTSDMNGDGQSGNDPIYIPRDVNDLNEIQFTDLLDSKKQVVATVAQEKAAFDQFINDNKCLSDQRGKIMERNSCTAPFMHQLNVSLRQSLNTFRMQNVSVQLDVFNFLNLLNKDWGHYGTPYSNVYLLNYNGLSKGSTSTLYQGDSNPIVTYDPKTTVIDYNNLVSNYQMQLSLRYTF